MTFSFFCSKTFKKQVIADPHLSYKCNAEKFESGGLLDKCINFSGEVCTSLCIIYFNNLHLEADLNFHLRL